MQAINVDVIMQRCFAPGMAAHSEPYKNGFRLALEHFNRNNDVRHDQIDNPYAEGSTDAEAFDYGCAMALCTARRIAAVREKASIINRLVKISEFALKKILADCEKQSATIH